MPSSEQRQDDAQTSVDLVSTVNGREIRSQVPSGLILADFLRDICGCLSVRTSCERGACGACVCLLNGEPVASCSVYAFEADGASIETLEGLGSRPETQMLAEAFRRNGSAQCGYCTSGFLCSATAFMRQSATKPAEGAVADYLESNICRCTGYLPIITAVVEATEQFLARDLPVAAPTLAANGE
jgi:carbon-monoxide dehydrogenase small subunit